MRTYLISSKKLMGPAQKHATHPTLNIERILIIYNKLQKLMLFESLYLSEMGKIGLFLKNDGIAIKQHDYSLPSNGLS